MSDALCSVCRVREPIEDGGRCATCIERDLDRAADAIRGVFGPGNVEELSDEEVEALGFKPTPEGWRPISPRNESGDGEPDQPRES